MSRNLQVLHRRARYLGRIRCHVSTTTQLLRVLFPLGWSCDSATVMVLRSSR